MTLSLHSENHSFLVGILEDHQDGIFIYDCDTLSVHYANRAARTRCGWDGYSITNKRITDSSERFDEDYFWEHVAPLLREDTDLVPLEAVHETGPVNIQTRLSELPDGRKAFVSVIRDTSEQKQTEEARMQSFSELSHELRTPLTSIKGALRLLETGALGELGEDARNILSIASRNTERLLAIVNDILEYQRLDAGKATAGAILLDLVDIVRDSIIENAGYGWEHDASLALVGEPSAAMVMGDKEQLGQVMGNLLSNAIKHSPPNEEVTVRLSDEGDSWRVTVSDCGTGIPEDIRDGIFKRFTTAGNDAAKATVGTGLGLAIAKKIVTGHKGRIGFVSNPSQGTDFHFELPKAQS